MLPVFPTHLIPRPFADNGTFQVIPDTKTVEGRASWQEGFPMETQLPLAGGGIAPSRPDFNGVFNALSALAFWQQAGGPAVYRDALDYSSPAVVFHNGALWWCLQANGPGQVAGAVAPGSNTDYWVTLLDFLAGNTGGGSGSSIGTPVGTVITFFGANAPDGYFSCDGRAFSATNYPKLYELLGKASVPDLRGYFVRGFDTRNSVDPDGVTRAVGSVQGDAMRNLTGRFTLSNDEGRWTAIRDISGPAFYGSYACGGRSGGGYSQNSGWGTLVLDASKQVPVANEIRPTNVCLLYCIKHD